MTREELDSMRFTLCLGNVISRSVGLDSPVHVPTEADVYEHFQWCARHWEELQTKDQSNPRIAAEVQLFRQPVPTPVGIARWREFSAEYEFTYENVVLWKKRQTDGAVFEDMLSEDASHA